jgi:hypothetical protein
MLTSRKSFVDMGSVRRGDSMLSLSARKTHPLSSRMSHGAAHQRRRNGRHLWRIGIFALRFIARVRVAAKQPKLTVDEAKEIAAKYYAVMCLNDLASVTEFMGSLGVSASSEAPEMLVQVKFREGQALTLYQVLRLMTLLKRHHARTTGSDTVEAFTALAVDGRIPTDVFRATMMKFDLRVQMKEAASHAVSQRSVDVDVDDSFRQANPSDDTERGIDINRFRAMLSDEDDAKKREVAKRRFSRLNSIRETNHVSETFESASPTEPRTPSVSSPKPFEALLNQVRVSLAHDAENSLFKRDVNSEKSPLRSEMFPHRSNKRRWEFPDVVKRIDEVAKQGDVHRPMASRNARYCSSQDRPRLALLTPFTDLDCGRDANRNDDSAQMRIHRLSRQPPRGLPGGVQITSNRRSASVPLTERFPVLSKRRERLMDQLPHRNFESNGIAPWALSPAQRSQLAAKNVLPSHHANGDSDRHEILKHIASATLTTVNSRHS